MINLFARPYDLGATGFFFESAEEFAQKAAALKNEAGQPVEEFELQFIDGERLDAELFAALSVNQTTVAVFLERATQWANDEKQRVIIAVAECGHEFDLDSDTPDDLDVDLHPIDSLRELAQQFVDEGLFGTIPDRLQCYLDYDAIARDLGIDYSETTIAGDRLVYRCG